MKSYIQHREMSSIRSQTHAEHLFRRSQFTPTDLFSKYCDRSRKVILDIIRCILEMLDITDVRLAAR